MKKIIKNSIFFLLIVLSFYSCVEESKFINPVHFGLENGAFARFTEAPNTTVLLDDFLDNGFISDQLIDANDNMIRYSLTMTAVVGGRSSTIENFLVKETFPTTFEITSQSITSALGIPVSDINFGDSFQFVAVAIRNDNVLFNGNEPTYNEGETSIIGDETLGGGNTDITLNDPSTGYFSAMNFEFVIACDAFPVSDLTGTYDVVQASFFDFLGETSFVREVIGGPYNDGDLVLTDKQIAIIGGEWPSIGADDLILTISPNGVVQDYNEDGVAIPEGVAGLSENLYFNVEGIILPCINKIDILVNLNPLSGNLHSFVLQRQ